MSQEDRVRQMLEAGWTCGTKFLEEHIPRYVARIFDLGVTTRKRPRVDVEKRRCESHQHKSVQWEWRIPNGRLWQ